MSLTVGLTVDWPDEFVVPSFPVPPQVPKVGKRWGTWGKGWFFWCSVAKCGKGLAAQNWKNTKPRQNCSGPGTKGLTFSELHSIIANAATVGNWRVTFKPLNSKGLPKDLPSFVVIEAAEAKSLLEQQQKIWPRHCNLFDVSFHLL